MMMFPCCSFEWVCILWTGNLQKILSHDHPPEYSADFYAAYINILLGVFYTVCRDLKELRHLVSEHFVCAHKHMFMSFNIVPFRKF